MDNILNAEIKYVTKAFNAISLSESAIVDAMERFDTKFVFPIELLPSVLTNICANYKILEIEDHRIFTYGNLYFDTKDLKLYRDHHNGKLNRFKVRIRSYEDFHQSYFEVKFKTNKLYTLKKRILINENYFREDQINIFLENETGLKFTSLAMVLENSYQRISLINNLLNERVTFDFEVGFKNIYGRAIAQDKVIAEIKHPSFNASSSVFAQMMKEKNIRSSSVSKYCLGISFLYPESKINNFKCKLSDYSMHSDTRIDY